MKRITNYSFMSNFWNNISRYPRFFISSTAGLILILLTPLKNLLKIPKLRIVVISLSISFLILLYLILQSMLGF